MKKLDLINLLKQQEQTTTKTTRKDIIKVVAQLVAHHIPNNADIKGVNPTRSLGGVNLGEVMEVIAKSLFNNKLEKTDSIQHYDLLDNDKKVEVKFSTCDAYSHPINKSEVVDYYLLITYSKRNGLIAYKVPYAQRNEIDINNQGRITINQKVQFIDSKLTKQLNKGI